MYKKILIYFILLVSMISGGCFGDSHEIQINKSYTISAQEKQDLRNYILQTREVMRPYRNKQEELYNKGEFIRNNSSSVDEMNKGMRNITVEQIKNTENLQKELKKVQIPQNCPTAKRLALLRETMYSIQIKTSKDIANDNIFIGLLKHATGFFSSDSKKLDNIEEEIDNIFSLADIKPE